MSRVADPDTRQRLLDAAASLLAEHGPDALSTRRIAAQAGVSSMGVYTQFGSIAGLVQSVIADGFHRLGQEIGAVPETDDAVADLVAITWASIGFARSAPNLYQVMFGTLALGQYRPTTAAELHTGRTETLDVAVDACRRAISQARFRPADPFLIAHQWWCAVHGYNMLEICGYIRPPASEQKILVPMLETSFTGLGDDPERIRASLGNRA